ncbi:MAG TPA: hypothetical protein VN408_24360 [Actinoplanes sp.]|nr:hypothetical protein [Actinoplanes sp.]
MEIGSGTVVGALVVVALVALALWKAPRGAAIGLGIAMVLISAWLLNTLYLDEPFLEKDLNSNLEQGVAIAGTAVAGIALAVAGYFRKPRIPAA